MSTRQEKIKESPQQPKDVQPPFFSPRVVGMLADEVTRSMISRLPHLFPNPAKRAKRSAAKKTKKLEYALVLDTSAIIDRRILETMHIGLLVGNIIIPEGVLLELKHIADSQDTVKRERGRKGLEELDRLKKLKTVKLTVLGYDSNGKSMPEVDEQLILIAKQHKGRVITCDYNLEKKASIQGVIAINVNALAHALKVTAVPGEAVHIKLLHLGKEETQGIGYLDDGTMIVVEHGEGSIGKTIDVVISRVIQTATGRILFAKKI